MFSFTLILSEDSLFEGKGAQGQSMVEYGVVIAFLVILVVAIFTALGPEFLGLLERPISEDSSGDRQHAISSAIHE
jgi:hypothetical protein